MSAMTSERARDLFSEAYDGELDAEQKQAFEAALAADEELRADYDDFVETFQIVGALEEKDPIPVPNLLPKIQDRLRRRSRGRYYRDRFSERASRFSWMIMLLAVVTVLTVVAATLFAVSAGIEGETAPDPAPRDAG